MLLVTININKIFLKKRSEISTKSTLAVKKLRKELKNGHVEKDMKSKHGRPMAAQ